MAQYSDGIEPSIYSRIVIDSSNLDTPTGLAYYDSSLPSNEKFAKAYDIYVASTDTIYSALCMNS